MKHPASRVQTGKGTMYAMMGAGAYGSSGVTHPLVAHLFKTCSSQDGLWLRSIQPLQQKHTTSRTAPTNSAQTDPEFSYEHFPGSSLWLTWCQA